MYLGLENMVRLAEVPAVNDTISRYSLALTQRAHVLTELPIHRFLKR